jgi:hypothetical protein
LLPRLIEAACASADHSARELMVKCAATHGVNRRDLHFEPEAMLEEHYLLRSATWNMLHVHAAAADTISQATSDLLRLDAAISVATLSRMIGYYKREAVDSGTWPDALAEVIRRWEATVAAPSMAHG